MQALEHTVLYEMPARKFVAVVKKYSRMSLQELADDAMSRFGLLAPRQRKRSGSCPEAILAAEVLGKNSPSLRRARLPPVSRCG